MPNPKTIEELLKMKSCRYYDGQEITDDIYEDAKKNQCLYAEIWTEIYECWASLKPFKMPDGYYHLPPDKQLGLPLGKWTFVELEPLINSLPFGTIKAYCIRYGVARFMRETGDYIKISDLTSDYGSGGKTYYITRQPYGYYNPITPRAAEENPPIKPTMVKDANGKEWACFTLTETFNSKE